TRNRAISIAGHGNRTARRTFLGVIFAPDPCGRPRSSLMDQGRDTTKSSINPASTPKRGSEQANAFATRIPASASMFTHGCVRVRSNQNFTVRTLQSVGTEQAVSIIGIRSCRGEQVHVGTDGK